MATRLEIEIDGITYNSSIEIKDGGRTIYFQIYEDGVSIADYDYHYSAEDSSEQERVYMSTDGDVIKLLIDGKSVKFDLVDDEIIRQFLIFLNKNEMIQTLRKFDEEGEQQPSDKPSEQTSEQTSDSESLPEELELLRELQFGVDEGVDEEQLVFGEDEMFDDEVIQGVAEIYITDRSFKTDEDESLRVINKMLKSMGFENSDRNFISFYSKLKEPAQRKLPCWVVPIVSNTKRSVAEGESKSLILNTYRNSTYDSYISRLRQQERTLNGASITSQSGGERFTVRCDHAGVSCTESVVISDNLLSKKQGQESKLYVKTHKVTSDGNLIKIVYSDVARGKQHLQSTKAIIRHSGGRYDTQSFKYRPNRYIADYTFFPHSKDQDQEVVVEVIGYYISPGVKKLKAVEVDKLVYNADAPAYGTYTIGSEPKLMKPADLYNGELTFTDFISLLQKYNYNIHDVGFSTLHRGFPMAEELNNDIGQSAPSIQSDSVVDYINTNFKLDLVCLHSKPEAKFGWIRSISDKGLLYFKTKKLLDLKLALDSAESDSVESASAPPAPRERGPIDFRVSDDYWTRLMDTFSGERKIRELNEKWFNQKSTISGEIKRLEEEVKELSQLYRVIDNNTVKMRNNILYTLKGQKFTTSPVSSRLRRLDPIKSLRDRRIYLGILKGGFALVDGNNQYTFIDSGEQICCEHYVTYLENDLNEEITIAQHAHVINGATICKHCRFEFKPFEDESQGFEDGEVKQAYTEVVSTEAVSEEKEERIKGEISTFILSMIKTIAPHMDTRRVITVMQNIKHSELFAKLYVDVLPLDATAIDRLGKIYESAPRTAEQERDYQKLLTDAKLKGKLTKEMRQRKEDAQKNLPGTLKIWYDKSCLFAILHMLTCYTYAYIYVEHQSNDQVEFISNFKKTLTDVHSAVNFIIDTLEKNHMDRLSPRVSVINASAEKGEGAKILTEQEIIQFKHFCIATTSIEAEGLEYGNVLDYFIEKVTEKSPYGKLLVEREEKRQIISSSSSGLKFSLYERSGPVSQGTVSQAHLNVMNFYKRINEIYEKLVADPSSSFIKALDADARRDSDKTCQACQPLMGYVDIISSGLRSLTKYTETTELKKIVDDETALFDQILTGVQTLDHIENIRGLPETRVFLFNRNRRHQIYQFVSSLPSTKKPLKEEGALTKVTSFSRGTCIDANILTKNLISMVDNNFEPSLAFYKGLFPETMGKPPKSPEERRVAEILTRYYKREVDEIGNLPAVSFSGNGRISFESGRARPERDDNRNAELEAKYKMENLFKVRIIFREALAKYAGDKSGRKIYSNDFTSVSWKRIIEIVDKAREERELWEAQRRKDKDEKETIPKRRPVDFIENLEDVLSTSNVRKLCVEAGKKFTYSFQRNLAEFIFNMELINAHDFFEGANEKVPYILKDGNKIINMAASNRQEPGGSRTYKLFKEIWAEIENINKDAREIVNVLEELFINRKMVEDYAKQSQIKNELDQLDKKRRGQTDRAIKEGDEDKDEDEEAQDKDKDKDKDEDKDKEPEEIEEFGGVDNDLDDEPDEGDDGNMENDEDE
jgi:hypothetical protein